MEMFGTWTRGACRSANGPAHGTWTDLRRSRDPQFRGHGLTQDAGGDIWVPGTRVVRVDSKTGAISITRTILKPSGLRMKYAFIDSKQNVWTSLSWANEIAKWDRTTEEISR